MYFTYIEFILGVTNIIKSIYQFILIYWTILQIVLFMSQNNHRTALLIQSTLLTY